MENELITFDLIHHLAEEKDSNQAIITFMKDELEASNGDGLDLNYDDLLSAIENLDGSEGFTYQEGIDFLTAHNLMPS